MKEYSTPLNEIIPLGKVTPEYLTRVEKYQQKKFERIGTFDINLLRELIERINEEDAIGEVEIIVISKNVMRDDTTSGLLVTKYNTDQYMALGGLADNV